MVAAFVSGMFAIASSAPLPSAYSCHGRICRPLPSITAIFATATGFYDFALLSKRYRKRRMAVLRYNLLMLAVGGLTMAAIASGDRVDAQSGQALAFAEHACLEYGVTPGNQTFERCVTGAAKAFDRGEPDVAYAEARVARAAREACPSSDKMANANGGNACADGLIRH